MTSYVQVSTIMPPAYQEAYDNGDAVDVFDFKWGVVEMPTLSTSTYPDIDTYAPTFTSGVYYFDYEYISTYCADVYGSCPDVDTFFTYYDGWALGVLMYLYNNYSAFYYVYEGWGVCIGDLCTGFSEYYNGSDFSFSFMDFESTPDASTPYLEPEASNTNSAYSNFEEYWHAGYDSDVGYFTYSFAAIGLSTAWRMMPILIPEYALGDTVTVTSFASQQDGDN